MRGVQTDNQSNQIFLRRRRRHLLPFLFRLSFFFFFFFIIIIVIIIVVIISYSAAGVLADGAQLLEAGFLGLFLGAAAGLLAFLQAPLLLGLFARLLHLGLVRSPLL